MIFVIYIVKININYIIYIWSDSITYRTRIKDIIFMN